MTRRQDSTLRQLVDVVIGDLKHHHLGIKVAAYRLLSAGMPFDAAVRVISRNTC